MTSFADEGGGLTGGATGGARVFIGSFNINSQDLSSDAARAWLKEAEGADIVALGLQVKALSSVWDFAVWRHSAGMVCVGRLISLAGIGSQAVGAWGCFCYFELAASRTQVLVYLSVTRKSGCAIGCGPRLLISPRLEVP